MSKNIIISGAAGNLGRAAVKRFVADGYSVIAPTEPGRPFAPDVPGVTAYEVDLFDENKTAAFVRDAVAQHGDIHTALLLAGGYAYGDIAATDTALLRKMVALNFETAYHVVRPVFGQMMQQKEGGRIVLVAARAALEPSAGKSSIAYSLSKSMLVNLAAMLNEEGRTRNVVVTVIVPSTIDTPENRAQMPKADFSRWVRPEKIADILAFITSPAAHPIVDPLVKVYGNG